MDQSQAQLARRIAKWALSGAPRYNPIEWISTPEFEDGKDYLGPITVPVERMRDGSCRTSACLAGEVAIQRAPEGTLVVDGDTLIFPDETSALVHEFAQEQLGLSYEQARVIFWAPSPQAAQRLSYVADHPSASVREIVRAFPNPTNEAESALD